MFSLYLYNMDGLSLLIIIIIIIIVGQFIKRRNIAEVITRALNKKLKQLTD